MDNYTTSTSATILATTLGIITLILLACSLFFCCLQRCSGIFDYKKMTIDSDNTAHYQNQRCVDTLHNYMHNYQCICKIVANYVIKYL
jgi:hypothetical protein